jgi:hypothetical protein
MIGSGYLAIAHSQSGGFKVVKACALVTKADVNTLWDVSFEQQKKQLAAESDGSITATTCVYRTLASSIDDSQEIEVDVRAARNETGSGRNLEQFRTQWKGTRPIAGIGDSAFWIDNPGILFVLDHHNWYTLWVGPMRVGVGHSREETLRLARLVQRRM